MNNLRMPLMSLRLKTIFDEYKVKAPAYKWLSVDVISNNKKIALKYFLLIFSEKVDVLDFNKTRMIDDDYIYGYFLFEKIKTYSFFPQPREYDGTLVVSEDLKNCIINSDISGVEFRKAYVTSLPRLAQATVINSNYST
jgi:hypothetical protein